MMSGEIVYMAKAEPGTPRDALLLSSLRIWRGPSRELVRLWSRGAFVGSLIMNHGDGALLAEQLGFEREERSCVPGP